MATLQCHPVGQYAPAVKKDVLIPDGFSSSQGKPIIAVESIADPKVGVPAVCLASKSEGLSAQEEMNAQVPIALLAPGPFEQNAHKIHVLVKNAIGQEQMRRRCMLQLGPSPLKYMDDAPKGCDVFANTEKIVLAALKDKIRVLVGCSGPSKAYFGELVANFWCNHRRSPEAKFGWKQAPSCDCRKKGRP